MFITLDGVDGTGKSTQIDLLTQWLRDHHSQEVVICRDPGSTPLGETVRELLLASALPIHRRSEMLLFMTARSQLVEEVIRPALDTGKTVICDRFLLATVVYQGYAGGLEIDDIWQVGNVATAGLQPDLTLLLDMPVEAAVKRIQREPDRIESQGTAYLEAVREGFLRAATERPEVTVIDAASGREEVQATIRRAVGPLLNGHSAL
ncbi:MAG: dTMP kinase [Planctomycetota bacterium]|nr:dTMP kinase [Planctomycetota bacterium]